MKFKQDITPVAEAAFVNIGFNKEAWDQLKDEENWTPEEGSELDEAVYIAVFKERWGDDVAVWIWERIKRILEPYAPERPDWLDDDGESELGDAETHQECKSETR